MTHRTQLHHGARLRVWGNPQAACALSMTVTQLCLPSDRNTVQHVTSLPRPLGDSAPRVSLGTGHMAPLPGAPQRLSLPAGKLALRVIRAARTAMVQGAAFSVIREWLGHACPQMPAKGQPCKQACVYGGLSFLHRLL